MRESDSDRRASVFPIGREERREIAPTVDHTHDFDRPIAYSVENDRGIDDHRSDIRDDLVALDAGVGKFGQILGCAVDVAKMRVSGLGGEVQGSATPDRLKVVFGFRGPDKSKLRTPACAARARAITSSMSTCRPRPASRERSP